MTTEAPLPPSQVWGKKFVIYAALGIPRVDSRGWMLRVDGMVERPIEYNYDRLASGGLLHYTQSFHCLLPNSFIYADGYWEVFGYHERANVWEEERFKRHVGKHSKKTAYGTA